MAFAMFSSVSGILGDISLVTGRPRFFCSISFSLSMTSRYAHLQKSVPRKK